MALLTIFALCRVPVVLGAFALALRHYRKKGVPLPPLPTLLLPLAGLLVTSAGDLCGNWFRACFVFGASHLCWFAFLLCRGKFSWKTAAVLALHWACYVFGVCKELEKHGVTLGGFNAAITGDAIY